MEYLEVKVHTTTFGAELVANVMLELLGDGVSVIDKNDLNLPTWDYAEDGLEEGYPDDVIVSGFIPVQNQERLLSLLNDGLENIRQNCEGVGTLSVQTSLRSDEEWKDEWKKYYRPVSFQKLIICPKWMDCSPEGKALVKIDPGLAFGTGMHETTRLVIRDMEKLNFDGMHVVDVGCGSGILGLCAAALGAKSVDMVDYDPQAVEAALSNLGWNRFRTKCNVLLGDLLTCLDPEQKVDIILANLTADILERMAPTLAQFMKSGTIILTSGILNTKAEEVKNCFESLGLNVEKESRDGEWTALMCRYYG